MDLASWAYLSRNSRSGEIITTPQEALRMFSSPFHSHLQDFKMASRTISKVLRGALATSRRRPMISEIPPAIIFDRSYQRLAISTISVSPHSHRPQLQQRQWQDAISSPSASRRTIFIQTQTTPNADVSVSNIVISVGC